MAIMDLTEIVAFKRRNNNVPHETTFFDGAVIHSNGFNASRSSGKISPSFPPPSPSTFGPSWTLNEINLSGALKGSEGLEFGSLIQNRTWNYYNRFMSATNESATDVLDESEGSYQNHVINKSDVWIPDPGSTSSAMEAKFEEGVNGMLIVAGVTLYLLALSTAVGNALVLHAIRTEKRLQTVSNLFIMSLAIADLTVGLIVMPVSAAYFVAGEWKWGVVVCQVWLAVDYTASTASIFNLFILSLDRYWSVSNPLRYLSKRTRKRALILIGGTWAAAALWLVPLLAWHHIFHEGHRQHPAHVCETEFSDSITFKIVTSALNFYGPSALMVILYCRIFRTIKLRSLDTLGRVTPLEASSHHLPATSNIHLKKTFRNLTLLALPDAENDKDLSTSFYKGIVVQVEYIAEPSSSGSNSSNLHNNTNNLTVPENVLSKGSPSQTPTKQTDRNCSASHKKNQDHQHHLACYPGSQTVWSKTDITSASAKENYRLSSLQNSRGGLAGLRGLLPERRGISATVSNSSNNNERKIEPINIAKEKKAARQLGVIMGAFFACWIPYFTLFPIIAFCDDCIPDRMHMAAMWLGYLNSALNPVIYPLCNQHFRRAFARMLRCRRRSPRHMPSVAFLPVP